MGASHHPEQERDRPGHRHIPGGLDRRHEGLEAFVAGVATELARVEPERLAAQAGVGYDPEAQEFAVRLYGRAYAVTYPSLRVREVGAERQEPTLWLRVVLAHYFRTADGTPLTGRWVSFRDLPGGLMYNRAFQGYSGDLLARGFGQDFGRLREPAARLAAKPLTFGDVSFWFDVLPRVPIAVVCYQGDDELPSTAQLLFDASAPHYLPTDALAALGGRLARLLLRESRASAP